MQIVSGVGVPKGGAAGEVLAKISGSDFDAAWLPQAPPAAGPAIASSDTPPLNPAKDQLWWESDSGNLYIWYDDSTSRQWVQIGVAAGGGGSIIGDVKQCFQPADHNGWIKLDGRATSTLSPRQQSAATALGFVTNLPDATNSVLLQNGGVMGAASGSWTLTQANLPNVTLTAANAAVLTTSGYDPGAVTTSSSGDHRHPAYGRTSDTNSCTFYDWPEISGQYRWNNGEGHIGNKSTSANYESTKYPLASAGAHTHTIDMPNHTHTVPVHNHTVPLGGSATPLTPRAIAVNMFVYLGA